MLITDAILRIIAAILEAYVLELRAATPEQIQAIVARRERDLQRWDRVLSLVMPEWMAP